MNESAMTAYVLPLLIGIVAGLRAMTAPAAVSWARTSAGSRWRTRRSPSSAASTRRAS